MYLVDDISKLICGGGVEGGGGGCGDGSGDGGIYCVTRHKI